MSHSTNMVGNPDLKGAACILKDLLYFLPFKKHFRAANTSGAYFLNVDQVYQYEPFYADFGPLHMGHLYRFCMSLNAKLKAAQQKNRVIYYYSGPEPQAKSNAAVLIGCFQILMLKASPAQAAKTLRKFDPYTPFRDASMGMCFYACTPYHCLDAVAKARKFKLFDFSTFDPDEYEFYECVENGDFNILVNDKFLAFSGPHSTNVSPEGYMTFTPEDYVPIFRKFNVSTIVRLNQAIYDKQRFVNQGLHHYDLFFVDGSTPSRTIVREFLKICRKHEGVLAVHCKAGLGRTGTLVGCFLMQEYFFSAAEAIAWIRLCRPGSVIGPQQFFLKSQEDEMYRTGRELKTPGALVEAERASQANRERQQQQQQNNSSSDRKLAQQALSVETEVRNGMSQGDFLNQKKVARTPHKASGPHSPNSKADGSRYANSKPKSFTSPEKSERKSRQRKLF